MSYRIEICGGIGSGKTSLAGVLEKKGFLAVYEQFQDNPFLNEFYANNGEDGALETEIAFTLIHYNGIKKCKEGKIVCDYSMIQDGCYGKCNLKNEDKIVFEKLYNYIIQKIPPADLIIYLKCNVDCLLQRIKQRDRKMEQNISGGYLQRNIDMIEKNLPQDKTLIIQSDKYNFLKNDLENVLKMIDDNIKKTEYV